jgi:hypothetical protein
MLLAAFPKYVFWPLLDWSVAVVDTLRVAALGLVPVELSSHED